MQTMWDEVGNCDKEKVKFEVDGLKEDNDDLQTTLTISESKITKDYDGLFSAFKHRYNDGEYLSERRKLKDSEQNRMYVERDILDNEQLIASMKVTATETLMKLDKSQLDFKELKGRCHDIEGNLQQTTLKLEVAVKKIEELIQMSLRLRRYS
jgi:hypothetical protein